MDPKRSQGPCRVSPRLDSVVCASICTYYKVLPVSYMSEKRRVLVRRTTTLLTTHKVRYPVNQEQLG